MVVSLSKPAGVDGGAAGTMSFFGNIRGKQQESSLSTSAMKRPSSASAYACTVTPPMTLPSRGWGDRYSGSEGCGVGIRHFSGFSRNSNGDTGSTTGSCSSGSSCGGRSSSSSAAGGGGGGGGSRSSSRSVGVDCEGRELKQFHLSDGFSSAEEETWGSEGEIEETVVAGRRRALVTLGPNKYLGANNTNGSRSTYAEEEDRNGEEESRGLLARGGSRPVTSGAPACGGLLPGVGTRRKAAMGAGRAKRRASFGAGAGGGARRDVEGRGPNVSSRNGGPGGRCGGGGGDDIDGREVGSGSGSGSPHKKRPLKVSRRLFIEIENKASEPPPPTRRQQAPAGRGRAAATRRPRGGAAGRGLDPGARARRLGCGVGGGADDEQGDSGDEAICGCAERCLRVMDAWYHTLTGSTARVKFSELDQGSSSIP